MGDQHVNGVVIRVREREQDRAWEGWRCVQEENVCVCGGGGGGVTGKGGGYGGGGGYMNIELGGLQEESVG